MSFPRKLSQGILFLAVLSMSCSENKDPQNPTREPVATSADSRAASASDSSLADIYFAKGDKFFYDQGHYDSAAVYHGKAAPLYKAAQNWQRYVRGLTELARAVLFAGRNAESWEHVKLAAEVAREELPVQHPAWAFIHEIYGRLQWGDAEYDASMASFEKELAIRERYPDSQAYQDIYEVYTRMAIVYMSKGDYDAALTAMEQSLEAKEKITSDLQDWKTGDIYFAFGNLNIFRGEYDLALEYYFKTESIWKAVRGDPLTDYPSANMYHNMGECYGRKGEYERALTLYGKALGLYRDLFPEESANIALNHHATGNAYLGKRDYASALKWYEKALKIKKYVHGENHPEVASIYGDFGRVYAAKLEYVQAMSHYKRAAFIYREQFSGHHPDLARSYNLMSDVHLNLQEYDKALKTAQKALQANAPAFRSLTLQENPDIEQALSGEQLLESLQKKAKAFALRGTAVKSLSDLRLSLSACQVAMRLIDQMRSGYKAEDTKFFLAEKAASLYDIGIGVARSLHSLTSDVSYLDLAFQFVEKSRMGILLEALAEADAKRFSGIPDSILAKERSLRVDLAFYNKSLAQENSKGSSSAREKIVQFQNRLFDLKRRYEDLVEKLEQEHPVYYNLKYQQRTARVKEIQDGILDDTSVLLEYFVGPDSICIFVLSRDQFKIASVGKDADFEKKIYDLRAGIINQNYYQYVKAARSLYHHLLQPIESHLDVRNLIVIPDGPLSYVPFETLLIGEMTNDRGIKDYRTLPFLIKKYAVSYAYSATLLLETVKRRPKQPRKRDYLAYAPIFEGGMPAESRAEFFLKIHPAPDSTRSLKAGYLPASREEVLGVMNLFNLKINWLDRLFGGKTLVYLGREANEENLKSQPLSEFRYIHLATHGIINESAPNLSGLIFAQSSDKTQDDILYLGEIYNLTLNADLVVLSACETGLGKLAKGEGLIGLARGFLYAGADNLLVSLWQVNDRSTSNLMYSFYEEVLDGSSKAAALREAKLQLIEQNSKYARPYYWAPFVLIGK